MEATERLEEKPEIFGNLYVPSDGRNLPIMVDISKWDMQPREPFGCAECLAARGCVPYANGSVTFVEYFLWDPITDRLRGEMR